MDGEQKCPKLWFLRGVRRQDFLLCARSINIRPEPLLRQKRGG